MRAKVDSIRLINLIKGSGATRRQAKVLAQAIAETYPDFGSRLDSVAEGSALYWHLAREMPTKLLSVGLPR